MKFSYPDLEAESVNNKRYYHTPLGAYPSITTILGTTMPEEKAKSLENWRQSLGPAKADAYSRSRADHGTNVHLLAERFLKGEHVEAPLANGSPIPHEDLVAFNALKLKLKKVEEVWGQEVALFSEHYEVAGRCDLIGVWKNKPVIIDFKTSARMKSQDDIYDYRLQLAFYGHAHNEMFGTNIEDGVVLMVAANGFPLEFNFKLAEYFEPLQLRVEEFWIKTLGL